MLRFSGRYEIIPWGGRVLHDDGRDEHLRGYVYTHDGVTGRPTAVHLRRAADGAWALA